MRWLNEWCTPARIMAIKTPLKYAVITTVVLLICSCSGGNDEGIGNGPAIVYIALRAINDNNESSGFSNEVDVSIGSGSEVTLSFNEPIRQMDGNCLSSRINQYVVHYGMESGSYTEEIDIPRDSTQLECTAVDSDPQCGDITSCSIVVSI